MNTIVEDTLRISKDYFKTMGFSEAQIEPLLVSGRNDLRNELDKLYLLIEERPEATEQINRALHALKGLLLNLGNRALAEKLVEAREVFGAQHDVQMLRELLFAGGK